MRAARQPGSQATIWQGCGVEDRRHTRLARLWLLVVTIYIRTCEVVRRVDPADRIDGRREHGEYVVHLLLRVWIRAAALVPTEIGR